MPSSRSLISACGAECASRPGTRSDALSTRRRGTSSAITSAWTSSRTCFPTLEPWSQRLSRGPRGGVQLVLAHPGSAGGSCARPCAAGNCTACSRPSPEHRLIRGRDSTGPAFALPAPPATWASVLILPRPHRLPSAEGRTSISTRRFLAPGGGYFGNLGRNVLIGPGLVNLDAALHRTIRVAERHTVQFRAEVFTSPTTRTSSYRRR